MSTKKNNIEAKQVKKIKIFPCLPICIQIKNATPTTINNRIEMSEKAKILQPVQPDEKTNKKDKKLKNKK